MLNIRNNEIETIYEADEAIDDFTFNFVRRRINSIST